ncbi:hypothetical protein KIPB_016812, partial [Kipferlia bialata]
EMEVKERSVTLRKAVPLVGHDYPLPKGVPEYLGDERPYDTCERPVGEGLLDSVTFPPMRDLPRPHEP